MKRCSTILCALIAILWISTTQVQAQETEYTDKDVEIFNNYVKAMNSKELLSIHDMLVETAKYFSNTPYVAGTLEKSPEHLIVNLREMDCTTLVENALALTYTLWEEDATFEAFCNTLRDIRYRSGEIKGYTSRLHYPTDWLYDNESKGWLEDVSQGVGGQPYIPTVNYMSAHSEKYPMLANNQSDIDAIKKQENIINERSYYYIPKEHIDKVSDMIATGDVVLFTSATPGLDVSHMGVTYWDEDKLTFIHASTRDKKVVVNPTTIDAYTKNNKTLTGIMIGRLIEKESDDSEMNQ